MFNINSLLVMETSIVDVKHAQRGEVYAYARAFIYTKDGGCVDEEWANGNRAFVKPCIDTTSYDLRAYATSHVWCWGSGGGCSCRASASVGSCSSSAYASSGCGSDADDKGNDCKSPTSSTKSKLLSGVSYSFSTSACRYSNSGYAYIYGFYTSSGKLTLKTLSLFQKIDEVFTSEVVSLPVFESGAVIELTSISLSSSNSNIVRTSGNKAYPVANGVTEIKYTIKYKIKYPNKSNSEYSVDLEKSIPVTVKLPAPQTLTYTGPSNFIVGESLSLSTSSTSGLTDFVYSCSQAGAIITENEIVFTRPGVYTIEVTQPGDSDYEPATLSAAVICGIDNFSPVLSLTS